MAERIGLPSTAAALGRDAELATSANEWLGCSVRCRTRGCRGACHRRLLGAFFVNANPAIACRHSTKRALEVVTRDYRQASSEPAEWAGFQPNLEASLGSCGETGRRNALDSATALSPTAMLGDLPCSQKSHDLARGLVPECSRRSDPVNP